jgi:hypothetical protein
MVVIAAALAVSMAAECEPEDSVAAVAAAVAADGGLISV